jgi:DNA-binding CsgD family transcriptional regulator
MTPEQASVVPFQTLLFGPVPEASYAPQPSAPTDLTAREMEVLQLLARGLSNAQIAEELVVSLLTVKAHLRSIYSKLGVTSRSAATRFALEHTSTECHAGGGAHLFSPRLTSRSAERTTLFRPSSTA